MGDYLRIIVVSDSHDNLFAVDEFLKSLGSIKPDLLIHLGDIVSPFTLKRFLDVGVRFTGVFGNNDGDRVKLKEMCSDLYEQPVITSIDGIHFVLFHGFGTPETTLRVVESLARSMPSGIVLYGHTHKWDLRMVGGAVIANPGALSGYLSEVMSYLSMSLSGGKAVLEVRELLTGKILGRLEYSVEEAS